MGVIVMQHTEIRVLRRAFHGLRHCQLSEEHRASLNSYRCMQTCAVLSAIKLISNHHLRRRMHIWKRRIKDGRIRSAIKAKSIIRKEHFVCYTVFRAWKQHVGALLMDISMRIFALQKDLLHHSLSQWLKFSRLRRAQYLPRVAQYQIRATIHGRRATALLNDMLRNWCQFRAAPQYLIRATVHERRETALLNDMLRKWCQFRLRSLRDRRSQTLAAYFHGHDMRAKPVGGFLTNNGRIAWHVFSILHFFWFLGGQRRHLSRIMVNRHDRKIKGCALEKMKGYAHFNVCLERIYGLVLRRRDFLAVRKFWGAWKSFAFKNRRILRFGKRVHGGYQAAVCNRYLQVWYECRCERIKSLLRTFKAIAWSNVRVCRLICFAWSKSVYDRRYRSTRQHHIATKNTRYRLRTVLSKWWIAHEKLARKVCSTKIAERHMYRSLASKSRMMMNQVLEQWSARCCRQRVRNKAYWFTYHMHCKSLLFQMFLSWADDLKKRRNNHRAYMTAIQRLRWKAQRRALSGWFLHVKRSLCIRIIGRKFEARRRSQQTTCLNQGFLAALKDAVKKRKMLSELQELRVYASDDLVELSRYKCHVGRCMHRNHLKRSGAKVLREWVAWRRHGPKALLYICKPDPEWVLAEIFLKFPAQQLFQDTLSAFKMKIRTLVRDECLLAIGHVCKVASNSPSKHVLHYTIQVLDVCVVTQKATVQEISQKSVARLLIGNKSSHG